MLVYDSGKPYLHTSDIRWSYGSMVGRPADWSAQVSTLPPQDLIPTVAAAGFNAIEVDRFGFADNGSALEGVLRKKLGPPVVVSNDGRHALYDLRPYRRTLVARVGKPTVAAAGAEALRPVSLTLGEGFYGRETAGLQEWQWSDAPSVQLQVSNPGRSPQSVVFSTEIAARTGRPSIELSFPDGSHSRLTATSTPHEIRRVIEIPPGVSEIDVQSTAAPGVGVPGDPRVLYLQFFGAQAVGRHWRTSRSRRRRRRDLDPSSAGCGRSR